MTSLVAALVLQAPTYAIPTGRLSCELNVAFEGFLPILKGAVGKSTVRLVVGVEGLVGEAGRLKAAHELTEFRVTLNGSALPFNRQNVIPFLPRTTIEFTPQGSVVKTDAPDKDLPVTLPGLDIRRFPEVSYLPIELPKQALAPGVSWTFERSYGGFPMVYQALVSKLDGDLANIEVRVSQKFAQDLNEYRIPLTKASKASGVEPVYTSETTTTGAGVVQFDFKRGRAISSRIKMNSVTAFKGIKIDQAGEDKLSTELDMTLK